jgi:hypothetical protein
MISSETLEDVHVSCDEVDVEKERLICKEKEFKIGEFYSDPNGEKYSKYADEDYRYLEESFGVSLNLH